MRIHSLASLRSCSSFTSGHPGPRIASSSRAGHRVASFEGTNGAYFLGIPASMTIAAMSLRATPLPIFHAAEPAAP
jgi:hypothetical protein